MIANMLPLPHQSVLYDEIIHALRPTSSGRYIDGTVGAGGHARGILEASAPGGHLLGLDIDPQALEQARKTLAPYGGRVSLSQTSYTGLLDAMHSNGWQAVDGIVLDLGVSSMQLDQKERGFSFQHEAPLDMRFNPGTGTTAAELINKIAETELAQLLFQYGEEPQAKKIAKLIIQARPIATTTELAAIVMRAYRRRIRNHPATRTFQALRIAVNNELSNLEKALPLAVEALHGGGRLAVIAFHSLEDRIVKTFIRIYSKDQVNPPYEPIYKLERQAVVKEVNRKPIVPGEVELNLNPRARSARLRVIEKL